MNKALGNAEIPGLETTTLRIANLEDWGTRSAWQRELHVQTAQCKKDLGVLLIVERSVSLWTSGLRWY